MLQTDIYEYLSGHGWRITIDDVEKSQNNGWTLSEDGWLTIMKPKSEVNILVYLIGAPEKGPLRFQYRSSSVNDFFVLHHYFSFRTKQRLKEQQNGLLLLLFFFLL
jgi:hypothetical protein